MYFIINISTLCIWILKWSKGNKVKRDWGPRHCVVLTACHCEFAAQWTTAVSCSSPGSLSRSLSDPLWASCSAVTLFLGFLVFFPSSSAPPIFDSLCCSLWIIPLCSLSLCQFNHFSHFKMTIPQFYRSSCLSLPVSTLTATPTCPLFANVWPGIPSLQLTCHYWRCPSTSIISCMGYVPNYLTSLIWTRSWRGTVQLSPPSPTVCTQLSLMS